MPQTLTYVVVALLLAAVVAVVLRLLLVARVADDHILQDLNKKRKNVILIPIHIQIRFAIVQLLLLTVFDNFP